MAHLNPLTSDTGGVRRARGGGAGGGPTQGTNTGANLQNCAAELQIQHKVGIHIIKDFIERTNQIKIFRDLVTIPKPDEAHTDLR